MPSSPEYGKQGQDYVWRPQQDSDSEALSYGSSRASSSQISPQPSRVGDLNINGLTGGGLRKAQNDLPALGMDGKKRSRLLDSAGAQETCNASTGGPSKSRGSRRLVHGTSAHNVNAEDLDIDQDANLDITIDLDKNEGRTQLLSKDSRKSIREDRNEPPGLAQLYRRETNLPTRRCKCDRLHPYFSRPGLKYPNFDAFPGKRLGEFLVNVGKVAGCSAHDKQLKEHCVLILATGAAYHEVCYFLLLSRMGK